MSLRQLLKSLSYRLNRLISSAELILPVLSSLLLKQIEARAIKVGLYWHIRYSRRQSCRMNEQYVDTWSERSRALILCYIWLREELQVRLKFNFRRTRPSMSSRSAVRYALSQTSTNLLISGTQISSYFDAISRLVMPRSCSFDLVIVSSLRNLSIRLIVMKRVSDLSLNFSWTSTIQLIRIDRMLLSISVWYCMKSRRPIEQSSQSWIYWRIELSQTRASLGNYFRGSFSGDI